MSTAALRQNGQDDMISMTATNPAAERYITYAQDLLDRAQVAGDSEWADSLNRMAGQMLEIAIYLGAKTH